MKRLLASLALIAAVSALSGCYYDPGYSYVRGSGYCGDAYYGDGRQRLLHGAELLRWVLRQRLLR